MRKTRQSAVYRDPQQEIGEKCGFSVRYVTPVISIVVLVAVAAVLFQVVQRRLSDAALAFTVNPEVLELLERSLADQRELARLDPQHTETYRGRFDELERTVHRLQILSHSREDLVRRYETILMVAFAVIVLAVGGLSIVRHLRLQPRLARLQDALSSLAAGRTDLEVGVAGRDLVGRIAAMVEQTSRVMARDRRRLAELNNLSSWQEAARRQAHEIRTPLTAARLEVERVRDLLRDERLQDEETIEQATNGALQEIDRLGRFTVRFTSFARLPQPQLEEMDLSSVVQGFVDSYRGAWPNLTLEIEPGEAHLVAVDREMLRQVFSNLCDNSARAMGGDHGTVRFVMTSMGREVVLDVEDDGPGVDESVRDRLFEPYATTRTVGEGMGLGLAISKKTLLDLGGDLELHASSPQGTILRLTLPRADAVEAEDAS